MRQLNSQNIDVKSFQRFGEMRANEAARIGNKDFGQNIFLVEKFSIRVSYLAYSEFLELTNLN